MLFLLAFHVFVLPYKSRFANAVEAFALFNLCVIGSLTLQDDERNIPSAVFLTLVSLPVAYVIIFMLLGLWKSFQKR